MHDFVDRATRRARLVAPADTELYLRHRRLPRRRSTRSIGFYRNYDSIRYVGDSLVIRHAAGARPTTSWPRSTSASAISCSNGEIARAAPFEPERKENDKLDLARIAFTFAKHRYGDLRDLIDTVNSFVDA